MRDFLVRLLGFPATLIHGDTMVLDRWLFLRKHLPAPEGEPKRLVEVGCGSGAFTIGAALRGYDAIGLSWDEAAQEAAIRRAGLCQATSASFRITDVRNLDRLSDLHGTCDTVICCETIEHIIDDRKLMADIARCMKPGATLLLSSPNFHFRPMGGDEGPFPDVEDGRHVRRGYTKEDLARLCAGAGLRICCVGYCSGFLSQQGTKALRALTRINSMAAWALILPFRVLPPLFDRIIGRIAGWPGYSITLVATKPVG
jgi:SAM-dependent methyltransferase